MKTDRKVIARTSTMAMSAWVIAALLRGHLNRRILRSVSVPIDAIAAVGYTYGGEWGVNDGSDVWLQ